MVYVYGLKNSIMMLRCNVAPHNRSTEILFKSDYAYVAILGIFSLLGGYTGKKNVFIQMNTAQPFK